MNSFFKTYPMVKAFKYKAKDRTLDLTIDKLHVDVGCQLREKIRKEFGDMTINTLYI